MGSWWAVDLDGTLARYDGWQGDDHIGDPIWPMVDRVRKWLAMGRDVRIFTARVSNEERAEEITRIIQDWTEKHLGARLPVTNKKDFEMVEAWDDRCIQVEPNTGIPVDPKLRYN